MLRKSISNIFLLITLFFCGENTIFAAGGNGGNAPVVVEASEIKLTTDADQTSAIGTLISIPGITVKPEISGRITKISFKSGDFVQKGDVLIEINPDIVKAKLDEAIAKLRLNKLNYSRAFKLYQTHDISKSDFDQAQANYYAAKAQVESAQATLQQSTIVAPFAGRLGLSQVTVGDYVNSGQNIVNLQTIDPLKVDFSIPETYQNKVAIGQQVSLRTEAYPQIIFTGNVEAFESLINQNNRTLNVRANVPNKDGKLIPGGFVEVTLKFSEQKLIMIPQTAIVYAPDGNYVFKIVANTAEKTPVTLGEKNNNNVVVKTGLKVGDVVVTAGQIKLYQGAKVVIVETKKQFKK